MSSIMEGRWMEKTVDTTTVKSAVTVSGARDGEGRALEFVIW